MEIRVAVDSTDDPITATAILAVLFNAAKLLGFKATARTYRKSEEAFKLAGEDTAKTIALLKESLPDLTLKFVEQLRMDLPEDDAVTAAGAMSALAFTEKGVVTVQSLGIEPEEIQALIDSALSVLGIPEGADDDNRLCDYIKNQVENYLTDLGIPYTEALVRSQRTPDGIAFSIAVRNDSAEKKD